MDQQSQSLQELRHIKKMMERSSRFISLSGLSGISAGVCALAGTWLAYKKIICWQRGGYSFGHVPNNGVAEFQNEILKIALLTFLVALITSVLFTYLRSKRNGTSLGGNTTFRLLWNTVIPLAAGGLFLIRSMQLQHYGLIAPGCLIFYGLALVNASKYTLGEVGYLGYGQILLGIINLWIIAYGLFFWATGFGVLHIVYGVLLWLKYERKASNNQSTIVSG